MCKFREVSEKDFQEISNLIKSEDELFLVYPKGEYPLTVDQVKDISESRIELTVAVNKGKIIGFANLYNYEPSAVAFIGNVIIDSNYRGRGVGRKIIKHMLIQARDKYSLPEVRISVFSDNVVALLLYSDFGFIPYSIEERSDPKGRRAALIHLKKPLEITKSNTYEP